MMDDSAATYKKRKLVKAYYQQLYFFIILKKSKQKKTYLDNIIIHFWLKCKIYDLFQTFNETERQDHWFGLKMLNKKLDTIFAKIFYIIHSVKKNKNKYSNIYPYFQLY